MSKRGSVQLLLLSFRPRAKLGWGIGAAVVFLILIGLVQVKEAFPLLAQTGLAQALHQSAWRHALAGQSEPQPWPWDAMAENMSLAPSAKVPRLGLSAAILKHTITGQDSSLPRSQPASRVHARKPSAELGDVAVGDNITVTGADGSSHVYRVTSRGVVDPHLADNDPGLSDGHISLVTCWPLDPFVAGSLRLVIQATEAEPPSAPQPSTDQRNL